MKNTILFFTGLFMYAALACSGNASQNKSHTTDLLKNVEENPDLIANLTGIDESTHVKIEEEETPEAPSQVPVEGGTGAGDTIGGYQGAFIGILKIDNKQAGGTYMVQQARVGGEVVKENIPIGTQVSLDPGRYDIVFTTDEVAGNPKQTLRDVEIPSGQRIKREVKMPVGQITLSTGARCKKTKIRIRPKGATDWYKGKFQTCVPIILMSGNYEAEKGSGRHTVPISGIQVYDGGIRKILIRSK